MISIIEITGNKCPYCGANDPLVKTKAGKESVSELSNWLEGVYIDLTCQECFGLFYLGWDDKRKTFVIDVGEDDA